MNGFFRKKGQVANSDSQEMRRLFYINDRERNSHGPSMELNYIRTTKYTLATFLPLSLMFQFKRLPNFYFLI